MTIPEIDRAINANRKQLRNLERIDLLSAASWQDAWDRHPDLRAIDNELFRQRGNAQRERDEKAFKLAMRPRRHARPKKCPTCGHHTLAA